MRYPDRYINSEALERNALHYALIDMERWTGFRFEIVDSRLESDVEITSDYTPDGSVCPSRTPDVLTFLVGCAELGGDNVWISPMLVRENESVGSEWSDFKLTIQHELVHALFGLGHTDYKTGLMTGTGNITEPLDIELEWIERAHLRCCPWLQ